MKCPSCKLGELRNHYEVGMYCVSCGLIVGTYKSDTLLDYNITYPGKQGDNAPKKPKKKSKSKKRCFGCKSKDDLSRHHIIPKRIKKSRNKNVVILCGNCHRIADLLATRFYEGTKIIPEGGQ